MDSKTREPIIGASITVEGEKTGSISDIDGRFEIEAPEYSRLCVSYVGYVTQLVPVKANSLLEVWMSEDTKVIDEVVVVGYGAVSKTHDCHCPGEAGKDSTSGSKQYQPVINGSCRRLTGNCQ